MTALRSFRVAILRLLPPQLRRWLARGRLAALVILAVVLAVRTIDPAPVQLLLMRSFDLLQELFPRAAEDQPVIIVDIDDESLAAIGQWPWPRTVVAALVDRLTQLGAAVIGFDVLFAEPDRTSPAEIAGLYPDLDAATRSGLARLPSNDDVLAAALRRSQRVVLAATGNDRKIAGAAPAAVKAPMVRLGGDPLPYLDRFPGVVQALPELREAAAGQAMITLVPEADNVVRRLPLVFNVQDKLFPALTFDMLRVLTGQSVAVRSEGAHVTDLVVAENSIPTDGEGRVWVHFAPHEAGLYVSARSILDGTIDPARIQGKLVLVGTSAIGLKDVQATPIDAALPGVEVHAQLLETILSGTYLTRAYWADPAELLMIAVAGFLMIVLVPISGARATLYILLVVGAAIAAGTTYLYVREAVLLDGALPLATSAVLYTVLVYASYMREEKQRRQIRNAFSQYLPPVLVQRLSADPSLLKLGGEFRTMTFLFSDIRGFTAISERYRNAAGSLTRLVNRFMTPMTHTIHAHSGTIDKYIGDCIMAFWNAPLDDPQHARNACRAALGMIEALETLNADLAVEAAAGEAEQRAEEARGGAQLRRRVYTTRLDIGIGVNTGDCIVGNMGSDQKFDYTVLGDSVNLAARLEAQSKHYGVTIVIGEETQRAVTDFATIELDLIAVKGRGTAARIFTLLGDETAAADPGYRAVRERHDAMLAAYRQQDWPAASRLLAECRRLEPRLSGLYELYDARIAGFAKEPPPADWNGVYVAETK